MILGNKSSLATIYLINVTLSSTSFVIIDTIWPSASESSSSLSAVYGNKTTHCSLTEKDTYVFIISLVINNPSLYNINMILNI